MQFANIKAQTSPDIKRTKHWYFGVNAGLDFSGGAPVAVTNGQVVSDNSASISDTSGNLLFYTDGKSVWNKNHQLMPNGTGLNGNSYGKVLIVPQPLNDSIYYIFTTFVHPSPPALTGFQYSMVNIKLNGGLGNVTIKNNPILDSSWERLTAVKHANGKDVWVAVTKVFTNKIYCYLLTSTGFTTSPVISSVGHPDNYGACQFKFSASGKKLAMPCNQDSSQIFDFDHATGILSNVVKLPTGYSNWTDYWAEFSPDESKLYLSRNIPAFGNYPSGINLLYQVDLLAGSQTNIINSITFIDTISKSPGSGIQRGSDGYLYVGRTLRASLGRINNPNAYGMGCNFDTNAVNLIGKQCGEALPNFVSSDFYDPSLLSGIETITNKIEPKIYPNPSVTGVFYTNVDFNNEQIEVYNILGDCLKKQYISENTIDLRYLDNGLYIIE
ncbi:MAG TPA: T9SS type A sorting domain-containing protein, partial [Nitrosopumilaceae archaeon]|nr:T9SS type A sorting domain-containing protein [Nitrosopumilaceae archaeon]